jgi:hypothetical protein
LFAAPSLLSLSIIVDAPFVLSSIIFKTFSCLSYLSLFFGLLSSQPFTAYCAFSFLFLRPFLPFFWLTPALSFSLRIAPFPSSFCALSFPFSGLLQLLAFHCVLRLFIPVFLAYSAFSFYFSWLTPALAFYCV